MRDKQGSRQQVVAHHGVDQAAADKGTEVGAVRRGLGGQRRAVIGAAVSHFRVGSVRTDEFTERREVRVQSLVGGEGKVFLELGVYLSLAFRPGE